MQFLSSDSCSFFITLSGWYIYSWENIGGQVCTLERTTWVKSKRYMWEASSVAIATEFSKFSLQVNSTLLWNVWLSAENNLVSPIRYIVLHFHCEIQNQLNALHFKNLKTQIP